MKSHPSIYHFEQTETDYALYLGEYSSLEGLRLLPSDLEIQNISLGASDYKLYGWATEKEFPSFDTSGELLDFLEIEDEIGLLVFDVNFKNFGNLNTHDDGECHFKFNNKRKLIEAINNAAPEQFRTVILAGLLEHPGKYIIVDEKGSLKLFHTFDQYLKENQSV